MPRKSKKSKKRGTSKATLRRDFEGAALKVGPRPRQYITTPWNSLECRFEANPTTNPWTASVTTGSIVTAINNQMATSFTTLDIRMISVRVWADILHASSANTVTATCSLQCFPMSANAGSTADGYQTITRSPTWTLPATMGYLFPRAQQSIPIAAPTNAGALVAVVRGDLGQAATGSMSVLVMVRVLWRPPADQPAAHVVEFISPAARSHTTYPHQNSTPEERARSLQEVLKSDRPYEFDLSSGLYQTCLDDPHVEVFEMQPPGHKELKI